MEKQTFQTFEYASIGAVKENAPEQYFLMNDDGTIISNGQVQYVAQVQDVEGVLEGVQSCAVYDVPQQQYFVDMDSNSEFVSGEELILQPGSSNSVYTNSFLLQGDHEQTALQMVDSMETAEQTLNGINSVMQVDCESRDVENCTQVTLDEDQFRLLEEKGRVILEVEKKIFLLDTFGLHDITDNKELINSLRQELYGSENLDDGMIAIKTDEMPPTYKEVVMKTKTSSSFQPIAEEQAVMQSENGSLFQVPYIHIKPDIDAENDDNQLKQSAAFETEKELIALRNKMIMSPNMSSAVKSFAGESSKKAIANGNATQTKVFPVQMVSKDSLPGSFADVKPKLTEVKRFPLIQKKRSAKIVKSISIKAQCEVQDFPNEIFIGKTASGKKLYAKVKSIKHNCPEKTLLSTKTKVEPSSLEDTDSIRLIKEVVMCGAEQFQKNKHILRVAGAEGLLKSESWQLVERALSAGSRSACSAEDVGAAEAAVSALLALPSVRPLLLGRPLLVSKIIHKVGGGSMESRHVSSLVTGRVAQFCEGDEDSWRFIYVPNMAHRLHEPVDTNENEFEISESGEPLRRLPISSGEPQWLMHLHITELLQPPHPVTTSIALLRRRLPLPLKKKVDSIHACSACAAMFSTEESLLVHQKTHHDNGENNPDIPETPIKVDEEKLLNINHLIVATGTTSSSKIYPCFYCERLFNRYSNLQRHMSSHFGPNKNSAQTSTESKPSPSETSPLPDVAQNSSAKKGIYACNMCSCSYFYPSTLTRHILTRHIDVNPT